MASEVPDYETGHDEVQPGHSSSLDEDLDKLSLSDDESTDCSCEAPDLDYDVEEDYYGMQVNNYLMDIYDLTGMEYGLAGFKGANVPVDVICKICSKTKLVTVRVECNPVWDESRIENDRVPAVEYFDDVNVISETDDDPDTSLQDCFSYFRDDEDEEETKMMQVLHSPEDEGPVNVICSYLERGRSMLCLPMTDRDPLGPPTSWCENAKILDKTLIIVTEHARLDFLSTVKRLLEQKEKQYSISVLLVARQGGQKELERFMGIDLTDNVNEFKNTIHNSLTLHQEELLDML